MKSLSEAILETVERERPYSPQEWKTVELVRFRECEEDTSLIRCQILEESHAGERRQNTHLILFSELVETISRIVPVGY